MLNWNRQNRDTFKCNTVIFYAWNEFTEGGWICPTAQVDVNGNIIKNTYINATNGDEVKYTSWDSTDFIDVGGYTKVAIAYEGTTPVNSYSAMYDSKKKYVSKISVAVNTIDLEKGNIVILKIPENVKYIRLSTDSGHLDNIKVYPIVNKEVTNLSLIHI